MSNDFLIAGARIAELREHARAEYFNQRSRLEESMGIAISFEDWLVVQLVMNQQWGIPEEGKRPHD